MTHNNRLNALLIFIYMLAAIAYGEASDSGPIVGARFPAISPDGSKVSFSYLGDIWTVPVAGGEARRMTVSTAYDGYSCWSPDGRWVAFNSTRDHNQDVYVIPSKGGIPRRMTFHSANDGLSSWSTDSKHLIIQSDRECDAPLMEAMIFSIPLEGDSLPTRLIDCIGFAGALSPDGGTIAFVRGHIPSWRKRYRGSADSDIWLKALDGSPARLFTLFDGRDSDPMWSSDGKSIYFLSDRDGAANVWEKPVDGGEARQLTHFATDGTISANISANGQTIVCELMGEIYAVDTTSGATRKIEIIAPSDYKANPIEYRTLREASEIALSPDGKEIAFVARGEVFAMEAKGGDAMRLTDGPARESDIAWSPDGTILYFTSDRNGSKDIFSVRSADRDEASLSKSRKRT
ncbi:MAG: PD40 domain-containing protein, partial [Candidatus Coatesbacteria bacterium]|nr:PD40 domain-containing protein [Candidatus Coatesbacteria bacterium]